MMLSALPSLLFLSITSEGHSGIPSNFTWRADGIGELHIEDRRGRLDFSLPGLSAQATFQDRVPWYKDSPDSAGPEVSQAKPS